VEGRGLKGGALALDGLIELTIALAPAFEREAHEGLRCDVILEGARAALGEAAAPIEAELAAGRWRVLRKDATDVSRARGLHGAGYTVREVAAALGTSKSRIHRLLKEELERLKQLRQELHDLAAKKRAARAQGHAETDGTGGTGGTGGTTGTGGTSGTRGTDGTRRPPPDPDQAEIHDLIRAIQIRGQPGALPPDHPATLLSVLSEDALRTALEAKLGSPMSARAGMR
jgi:AraC-like DNA-binding protein